MACGRFDLQVSEAAFLASAFGKKLTADQLTDMHPLRRLEKEPPDPEVERAVFTRTFDALFSE